MASRFTQSIRRHPVWSAIVVFVLVNLLLLLALVLATTTTQTGGYTPAH